MYSCSAHHSLFRGRNIEAVSAGDSNIPERTLEKLLMWTENGSFVFAVLVQVLGVIGVTLARLDWGRRWPCISRWVVLGCFILVGIVSIGAMRACGGCMLVFATTLPLMAVGATLDLRKGEYSAGF
jgi:hypothetical protein